MLKEFKKFLLRGNVVELAVAVVVGAAFTAVIAAVVRDFITPLLSAIQGKQDLSKYIFTFHHIAFHYGDFLNVLLGFLITAAVVFFLVIHPINRLSAMNTRRKGTPDPTTRVCPECLSEIPIAATRCKFCTSVVKPVSKTDKAKK